MKIEDITRQSLLYDFYGALLTERQREVMELYHEENLSLAEIAEEFDISRQGVHDALQKAEKALESYEEKLGLVDKFRETNRAVSEIDRRIENMISKLSGDKEQGSGAAGTEAFAKELADIREIIDKLEE